MIFEDAPWRAYKKVNEIFADAIVKEVTKDTLIWIHDYHLMLLPGLIRERLKKMGWSCAIGFSLHTPFPAADFWRALPVRNEMIEGMLASDLIGFHTEEYKQNFIGTCVNMCAPSLWIVGQWPQLTDIGVHMLECPIDSNTRTA